MLAIFTSIKKNLVCSIFALFLIPATSFAQKQNEQIDAFAKAFTTDNADNIEAFAQALTKPYTTEYDKARAIFAWMGTHIRYDFKKLAALVANGFKYEVKGTSKADVERKAQLAQDAEMLKCFRNKRGVCEDYSRLYKKMCDAVGLECQFIGGTAKHLSQRTKGMEHAWNAVKIQGKWQLLDATWGSGYCEDETFKAEYSAGFFAVSPRFFILNHFPSDESWQFLEKPISKETFKNQPWLNYGQQAYNIEDAKPIDAALKLEEGRASIKIKFTQKPPVLLLSSPANKVIPCQELQKDGYTILTFNANSYPFVYLNVGKTKQDERFATIGKFYLESN